MRRVVGVALVVMWIGACGATPTTLTVSVNVPADQGLSIDYLNLRVSGYEDGATQVVYNTMSTDDGGNPVPSTFAAGTSATLVIILPSSAVGKTVQVDVEAKTSTVDPNSGARSFPITAAGEASVKIAHGNTLLPVYLTAQDPSCPPTDSPGMPGSCDGGGGSGDGSDGGSADAVAEDRDATDAPTEPIETPEDFAMDTNDTASDVPVDAATDRTCPATTCVGGCVDLMTNNGNCGACGYGCVNGRTCSQGRCTPAWLPMTTAGQPVEQGGTASAGISGKLLVTGGPCNVGPSVTASNLYDSATNTWTPTGPMNSARAQHLMVSSGTNIYTFGGLTNCLNGNSIGPGLEVFDITAKTWTSIQAANEPAPRYAFGMTWTGDEVFLYGGSGGQATGGRYKPAGGMWRDASCALAGCERFGEFLFTNGNTVYMWGGSMGDAPAGKQFDLTNGTWAPWPVSAGQLPGQYPDDGKRIFVIKTSATGCAAATTVTIYDRATGQLLSTDTSNAPNGVINASALVWSGSEVIAWSGGCGANPSNSGGRYQPPPP
jgi:hypothetical protein